jgi:hypothetical protein
MGLMAYVNIPAGSRYATTQQVARKVDYLDYWNWNTLQVSPNDSAVVLDRKYQYRPDLLSYDVYGTVDLWWVFMVTNPDVIHDPIYDFKAGILITIPSTATLAGVL